MDVHASQRVGIYVIEHVSSGRLYIGSSADLQRRKDEHYRLLRKAKHHCVHLQSAWSKYGEESFCWRVIEIVARRELLADREQAALDATVLKYNTNPKADRPPSPLGRKHTIEARANMCAAQRGPRKPQTDKHRAALSAAMKGRAIPWRAKISASLVGKTVSPATRERLRISHLGKRGPNAGRTFSSEWRAKLSAARHGKVPWNKGRHTTSVSARHATHWLEAGSEWTKTHPVA